MFSHSIDNDENIIDALRCLLHLCRLNVLEKIMTDFTNSGTLQELSRLRSKAMEIVPKGSLKATEQLKILVEEFQLYLAYSNKDLNRVHNCIQFFRKCEERVIEFRAVNIWLHIPSPSVIKVEYCHKRLQCLLRMCKLGLLFITSHQNDDIAKNSKDFEDTFLIKDRRQKRQVSFNKFLILYIYDLILKADRDGRDIPDIASKIRYNFTSSDNCQNQNCRMHHIIPTSSILCQRLKLMSLQYTVMLQLDVLYYHGLLKEKIKEVLGIQRWWAENLVKCHIRCQSPKKSFPDAIYMALAKLPKHTRNVLIIKNNANEMWSNESKNFDNFEAMLKCMIVFQHQQDKTGINEFYYEMSNTKMLSNPKNLPVGFEYYCGNYQAIPVGRHLSLFFSFLYTKNVISAIISMRAFIHYALNNIKQVNLGLLNALGDLVSLMEFTTSLVFAVGHEYCDFCLPQTYLVNYFDMFTTKPLIPGRCTYSNSNYLAAIKDSLNQAQQLLDLLIYEEQDYSMIIL